MITILPVDRGVQEAVSSSDAPGGPMPIAHPATTTTH